jgi:tetratricopeptide (TPR) repeat protein
LSWMNDVAEMTSNFEQWARLAVVLAVLALLCISALAEDDTEDENSAESWYLKGYQLVSNGYYEEALQAYDKSLEIDPENATVWLDKSLIHTILGKQARLKSLDLFDKNLEENPQDGRTWWYRGAALYGLERSEEARESWKKALEIYNETLESDPEDAEAWFDKAEILISLGRNEEAIKAYDRAIELNSPWSVEAAMTKDNLLMRMGLNDGSQEAVGQA